MADSGLETGSMLSPQGTISEYSGCTDSAHEPIESSSIAIKATEELAAGKRRPSSSSTRDEIAEYEKRVLSSDPFYESNGESEDGDDDDDDEEDAPLQFSSQQPNSLHLGRDNGPTTKDRPAASRDITQNGKEPNGFFGTPPPPKRQSSNTSVNSYYFIDASSLNDDMDVATTGSMVGYPCEDNSNWSNPQMPTNCYASSPKFSSIYLNDDPVKVSASRLTTLNAQNHYEQLANSTLAGTGFDYLKTAKEDGAAITKKESLAVETKETDSGESAQHSPCPDNTKNGQPQQQQQCTEGSESEADDRRPSLIRRNTFELEADDAKVSSLRQQYERQQGTLVFQNSITQYSQHRIDDDDPYFEVAIAQSSAPVVPPPCLLTESVPLLPRLDCDDKYKRDASEKESSKVCCAASIEPQQQQDLCQRASVKFPDNGPTDAPFSSLPLSINNHEVCASPQVTARIRRHEAAPIISGGSSSSDFSKPTDSPLVKRRTESTPILSGGSVLMLEPRGPEAQPKARPNLSSWVVDMSDCRGGEPAKHDQTAMSSSFSPPSSGRPLLRDKQQPSSLGYFVNLDDIEASQPRERVQPSLEATAKQRTRRPSCDSASSIKSYCEFFVDLSDQSSDRSTSATLDATPPASTKSETSATVANGNNGSNNKKNIFSMFIDLNDVGGGGRVAKSSSSSRLAEKRQEVAQKLDSSAETAEQKKRKSGVFLFIESDSPIVRRRTLSSSRPAFKRHSWNMDKSQEQAQSSSEQLSSVGSEQQQQHSVMAKQRLHKRAQSLSVDRNATHDLSKILALKSSSSSQSLNKVLNKVDSLQTEKQKQQQRESESKDEAFADYDIRDTPPNSHVEILNEELLVSLKNRNYHELDAINEQTTSGGEPRSGKPAQPDDCASENSLWDKTESTETQQTRKSETFDISTSSTTDPSSSSDNVEFKLPDLLDITQNKFTSNAAAAAKQGQSSHEKMANGAQGVTTTTPSSFVKLSDLDKKPASSSANSGTPASTSRETPYRMSVSVTETSWIENRLIMSNRSSDLYRPYAKKLPLSIPKNNYEDFCGAEADTEAPISESDLSSLQSSMGRSGQGSTEETETSTSFAVGKPYNRLGEDLLRMFLDEINPDVTIDVGGRHIRAHKCILSSRCQYFAAILSGGWIESAGNVISLQGYSYNAVHFALCHIYSGESCVPDSISIVELATLADMLCLEGLKEVVGFTLKVKYCHLFHKPCKGCSIGVLECLPLAAAYGLDEVFRKSLRWVTRHFCRIWPTKEFATLPRELMDKCYHQHIVHMSTDNVLQTIMDCDKLLTTLPNVRWAEPVFRLVSNLLDASMKYLTDNFANVLNNDGFQVLDRELTWNISRLEDHLLAAAERLPPEQACKSYSKLDKIFTVAQFDDSLRTKFKSAPLFMDLMEKIRAQVEKCLVRDAARAARTNAWLKMDLELRRRIQEMACLVIMPNEPTKRPSRHSNFLKEPPKDRQDNRVLAVNRVTSTNRNLDLRRVKMAISEHNDRTLNKQTPLLQTRKVMIKPKTDPLERKLQSDKLANDNASRPKSWPNKVEVKSRYLEPRVRPAVKESTLQSNHEKAAANQQRKKILISSSDSSRTSSPAMKRAAERKALTKVPLKKDGKTLSSDSINSSTAESRLGARKQVATSKSCGMTRAESPSLRTKNIDTGLSIDSLSDPKKKALMKVAKLDASSDSLLTDNNTTSMTTPKSTTTNKSSPVLGKAMANLSISQRQSLDKPKKSSPLAQQRNNLSNATQRRPARSVESSTAASRSRAAATVSSYSGSLNLRKSLLDAAKAPDIPSKTSNSLAMTRSSFRQSALSMRSSFGKAAAEKKNEETTSQKSSSSPGSKRSPRTNVNSRLLSKSNIVTKQQKANKADDKLSNKSKAGADGPKFLNQISRSGTFLKDEPTILNKSDIETAAIDI